MASRRLTCRNVRQRSHATSLEVRLATVSAIRRPPPFGSWCVAAYLWALKGCLSVLVIEYPGWHRMVPRTSLAKGEWLGVGILN